VLPGNDPHDIINAALAGPQQNTVVLTAVPPAPAY